MITEVGTKKVLVIEDERDVATLIRSVLEDEGYDVCVYPHGDCLDIARSFRPDVVLCDYMLPFYNGDWVCSRLREELGPEVAVIMLSAMRQATLDWRTWGVDDFVSKPFDIDTLLGIVERATGADAHLWSQPVARPQRDDIAS